MKIKILRSIGRKAKFPPYKENQIIDADSAEAEKLIAAKLAVVYTPEPAPVLKAAESHAEMEPARKQK